MDGLKRKDMLEDTVNKLIAKYKRGSEIHDKQMNNPSNSAIEKNRHSYLKFQCEAFLLDLDKLNQLINEI